MKIVKLWLLYVCNYALSWFGYTFFGIFVPKELFIKKEYTLVLFPFWYDWNSYYYWISNAKPRSRQAYRWALYARNQWGFTRKLLLASDYKWAVFFYKTFKKCNCLYRGVH